MHSWKVKEVDAALEDSLEDVKKVRMSICWIFRNFPKETQIPFRSTPSIYMPTSQDEESEVADEKTEDVNSEESLVEKRERIGKVLRVSSLQPPGSGGKSFHNYREYIRAAHHSMPESPAAAMH